MKGPIIMVLRVITCLLLAAVALPAETITADERARLAKYMESTRKAFVDSVSGISDEQWSFKPSPERWSIAECAEHITVSEDLIFELITKKLLKGPAAAADLAEARKRDESVVKLVEDRSQKAQAPEFLRPSGRWPTRAAMIEHFNKSRARNIEFVRTTGEDLRAHSMPHPLLGPMDAYHWLLLISAHSARHTAQLNEVKTAAAYPGGSSSAARSGAPSVPAAGKHFLLTYKPVRATLINNATPEERATLQKHFEYLIGHFKENHVLLAGPRADGALGLVLLETADQQEAERIAANDPAVKAGLFTFEVHPFRVALIRGREAR